MLCISSTITLNKYSPCCLRYLSQEYYRSCGFSYSFTPILYKCIMCTIKLYTTSYKIHIVENGVCILGCKSQFLSCRLFNKYLFNRIFDAFELLWMGTLNLWSFFGKKIIYEVVHKAHFVLFINCFVGFFI